ncbi:MAG: sulfite exporter TauE/SafE family protein [Bacteroidota bacterium]
MAINAGYLLLGLLAGILSGFVGVGGGILIVPALVLIFGFSQHQAQGTSLALLLPPIGILAVWTYYKQGFVDVRVAAIIIAGFIAGSWVGAKYATEISNEVLGKVFGAVLMIIGLKMIIGK